MDKLIRGDTLTRNIFMEYFKPDPDLLVSEWSDINRFLTSAESPEPGKWNTDRVPYVREPMNCLSADSPWKKVVLQFASQLGKTEVGLNWLGYCMHMLRGPILIVQPTVATAIKYSKQRITPMIENSPVLKRLVAAPKSRSGSNTILVKGYEGGQVTMVGANSASGLSSIPIQFVFFDEVDQFPPDVMGQGSPLELAMQRTANFRAKCLFTGTPTIKGFSKIEELYEEGDRRLYKVPCLHCGEFQELVWGQVKWDSKDRRNAWYQCISCEKELRDSHKYEMLREGYWEPQCDGDGETASFHLSRIYSPGGWGGFGKLAVLYKKAEKNPTVLKPFYNLQLGLTYEDQGETVEATGLLNRVEDWGPRLPDKVVVLTAGIDVHDDRIELEVKGWSAERESWSIQYVVLKGNTLRMEVWERLDKVLLQTYPHSRVVPDMGIKAAAIDTQGHRTQEAYRFCSGRQGRRIWGIHGRWGQGRLAWPTAPSYKGPLKTPLYTIGVDTIKDWVYASLRILEHGPGFCHFPKDRGLEHFEQLTAEFVLITYSKGAEVRHWRKKPTQPNEVLDNFVYNVAALEGLLAEGFQLDVEWERMKDTRLKAESPGAQPRVTGQSRGATPLEVHRSSYV